MYGDTILWAAMGVMSWSMCDIISWSRSLRAEFGVLGEFRHCRAHIHMAEWFLELWFTFCVFGGIWWLWCIMVSLFAL